MRKLKPDTNKDSCPTAPRGTPQKTAAAQTRNQRGAQALLHKVKMMNLTTRSLIRLFIGVVPPWGLAADSKSINTAIDWLKTACVSGEHLEIKAEGDGGISFLKKGVQGKLYFSKKDARGVVDSLQGEFQRDNLQEQRECMQPYIDRILDAILGAQGATSSNNRQLPKGFSIDDEGFVLRADGKRICQTIKHDAPPPVVIGNTVSMRGGRMETVCKLYDGTWSRE
ncbi:MAG: hypothetical protein ACREXW_10765 [Gammaproteobacteria bacterium]